MGEVCSFDNKEAIKRRINEVFAAWEKGMAYAMVSK